MTPAPHIRRRFIRHPTDIPLEIIPDARHKQAVPEQVRDISHGGVCLLSEHPYPEGAAIEMLVRITEPACHLSGRVAWCQAVDDHFEIGVAFTDADQGFRARMVEQVCQIELYKRRVATEEGRHLDNQQAAQEWIQKYAHRFPEAPATAEGEHPAS